VRGRRRVVAAAAMGALLALASAVGIAAPAEAHAVLVSVDPADGARLETAPASVVLRFDEPVRVPDDGVIALDARGDRVDSGPVALDGVDVELPLDELDAGVYMISYRVVSADGHVVTGSSRFGVGRDADPVATASTDPPGPVDVAADVARGLGYLGAVLLVGVGAVVATLWRGERGSRPVRAALRVGWMVLLVSALTAVPLAAAEAAGAGWSGLVDPDALAFELGGGAAFLAAVRVAALIMLAPAAWGRGRIPPITAAPALAVLVSIAAVGHAAAGDDTLIAVPVTVLHLAAMAVWLGGVTVLVTAVLRRRADGAAGPDAATEPAADAVPAATLRRWSRVAFLSVAVLVLTGEYLGWRQLQPLPSLWSTGWGLTLLVKVGLVAAALLVAAVAQRAVLGAGPVRRPRLRAAVAIEAGALAAVLAVSTVLTAEPPARTVYGPAVALEAPLRGDVLEIRVDGTRRGVQTFRVGARDPSGSVVPLDGVEATLTSEAVPALALPLEAGAGGVFTGTASVPVAGDWTIRLVADLAGGAAVSTSTAYTVW